MERSVKVGNVEVVLPNGAEAPLPAPAVIVAEKPEEAPELEPQTYIFRTSDPFQYSIDQAKAVASISAAHKPWVRKTWFVLFVVCPILVAQVMALFALLNQYPHELDWTGFLVIEIAFLPILAVYISIWRRKVIKVQKTVH